MHIHLVLWEQRQVKLRLCVIASRMPTNPACSPFLTNVPRCESSTQNEEDCVSVLAVEANSKTSFEIN
jgi:hypothetical protein